MNICFFYDVLFVVHFLFFFSSRRRHTRSLCDWSSDVCSSDLQQAESSRQFAESMNLMSQEIGRIFGEMDLTRTQAQWEKAVSQAGSMEERMELFLESMEQSAISGSSTSTKEELVSDEEIDRMIQADVLAAEKTELGKLDQLESEIAKELGVAKQ